MTDLLRYRVIVKNGAHPTKSLTLRVYDLLAIGTGEALQLAILRNPRKHVMVLPVEGDVTEFQRQQLLARTERHRARFMR